MAGILFKTTGISNNIQKISRFIFDQNVCGLHYQKALFTFPSTKGGQDINPFWFLIASSANFSLYSRHATNRVNYCSLTEVVNSCVSCDKFWNSGMISGDFYKRPSSYIQMRHKSKNRQESMDEESDEDDALEDDDFEAPPNFKVIKIHASSTRADAVASHALDVGRNNLEESFLGSGLYLNGKKLLKKSVKMDESDYLDLVVEKADDQLKVKRVKLLKIYPEKTNKDKVKLKVRVWKTPFFIAKPESSPSGS